MKTAMTLAIGLISIGSAFAQMNVQKPFEITLGGVIYTSDLDEADTGILVGVDYYFSKNYYQQAMQFVGVRGHFTEIAGFDLKTYGIHYGMKYGIPGTPGNGNFYLKGAIGYYNSDFDIIDDSGLGGFAAAGWEMKQGFGLEVGYQIGPSVVGVDNKSFYGAVSFRL